MSAEAAEALGHDLWSWIAWRARTSPDRPLALDEHDRTLEFAQLHSRAERVAAALVEAGLRPGTRIAWIMSTRLESIVLTGALARLGCEQVPLMPSLGHRELGFALSQARPDHVLLGSSPQARDHESFVRAHFRTDPAFVEDTDRVLDLGATLPESDPSSLPAYAAALDDPTRWIFYTSGTTSNPKGVLHSDGTLLGAAIGLEWPHRFDADDRVSLLFPYAHIGGPTLLFSALRLGHALILVERFDPAVVTETLSRCGVTMAGSGPAFWQALIAAQRAAPDRALFPRLRALIGGGAAKPAHLHDEARQILGVPIVSGYGSTECPGLAYNHLDDPEPVLHTDGRAVEGVEIRISGANDGSRERSTAYAKPGEEGEILVRGPMLCRGYLGEARLPLDEAGFLHTGDLGRLDEAGQLVVSGRIKDIIIRKGENISAKEIEDLLGTHPAIADVAVVGLPDPERGERCCAIVVSKSNAAAPSLAEITAFCRQAGLMRFKHPEQLEVIEALPRNDTGKILKAELRKRFSE